MWAEKEFQTLASSTRPAGIFPLSKVRTLCKVTTLYKMNHTMVLCFSIYSSLCVYVCVCVYVCMYEYMYECMYVYVEIIFLYMMEWYLLIFWAFLYLC